MNYFKPLALVFCAYMVWTFGWRVNSNNKSRYGQSPKSEISEKQSPNARSTISSKEFALRSPNPHNANPASCLERASQSLVFIRTYRGGVHAGTGSGFVLYPDGIIVTNVHVLAKAESADVTFENGQTYPIDAVLGSSVPLDYAVVKIAASHLTSVCLDNPRPLLRTEKVYSFGTPLGHSFVATDGILSREMENPIDHTAVIQHTATIAPGNSGGPLLDAAGTLIGINTLIDLELDRAYYAIGTSSLRTVFQSIYEQPLQLPINDFIQPSDPPVGSALRRLIKLNRVGD